MVIKVQNDLVSNEYAESRKLAGNGEDGSNVKVKNGSVFTGNLNQNVDPVMARKEHMQRRAMRMWSDAVSAEQRLDKEMEERRKYIEKLQGDMDDLHGRIKFLSGEQEALKEKYGITGEESQQKDLELLIKKKSSNPAMREEFSDEELTRLKELEGHPLNEYLERHYELERAKGEFRKQLNELRKECLSEDHIIAGMKRERLKSHALLDAQKEKDEMMIAASEEAANMLMEEVKDKIDEEQEELEEKAEEKAEKEEAEEERLEAIREEKKEPEEDDNDEVLDVMLSEDVAQMDSVKEEIKQEVKKMMNEMKLVVEDLKGAAVDEQL